MMNKFRVFIFIFLTMVGFMMSLSTQAQTLSMFKNQIMSHQVNLSSQSQQQMDDDDVREQREEEVAHDIRSLLLDRPK